MGTQTTERAGGDGPGTFALEAVLGELAVASGGTASFERGVASALDTLVEVEWDVGATADEVLARMLTLLRRAQTLCGDDDDFRRGLGYAKQLVLTRIHARALGHDRVG
jgi:hypothetical protein